MKEDCTACSKVNKQRPGTREWINLRKNGRAYGFRYSAVDEARRLGLSGWVRNLPDGDVELVAEGPKGTLQRLATWAHIGPLGALVTDVEEKWLPYAGEFDTFRIVR
jgi:acylphosphatase